jgi:hypothetical protein
MPHIQEARGPPEQGAKIEDANVDQFNPEKAVSESEQEEDDETDGEEQDSLDEKPLINGSAGGAHQSSARGKARGRGSAYLEKVNERKRTWDYFEINHPKAISDKKLEQLKAKYTRRKTEASLVLQSKAKVGSEGKSEREGRSEKEGRGEEPGARTPTSRTLSMPVIEGLSALHVAARKKSLELAWDPLTGESLEAAPAGDTESVDSGRDSECRKLSSSSTRCLALSFSFAII